MKVYPVMLSLTGRTVVIIGGGHIAHRKALGFEGTGAKVIVVAPEIQAELACLPFVECRHKSYEQEDILNADLLFAATNDKELNNRIMAEAPPATWINNVSDGKSGSFMTPAVVRRDDLVISISTSGNSPRLAKEIKKQVETQFGADYGDKVNQYKEQRKKP